MLIDLPNTSTGETLAPIDGPLPSGHSRHLIPNGIQGTAQTIAMMQKMVGGAKRDDNVRQVVGQAIQKCTPKDYFGYAKALYEWVRDNIKYAYDPHNCEYLESPRRVLKNKIADCDSQDMLLCSMFEQVGLQSQFVTIKADPNRQDEYTHVYTRVMIPKVGWVVADPIMPDKWFGWEPPYPEGKRYWAASSDDADSDVDTTPSLSFPSSDSGASSQMSFDPVNGMTGMRGLGHGGHHSGRGNRGGGFWNGGGGDTDQFWGGNDNVYIMPVAVPVPDQIVVIEGRDIQPQEIESPVFEENFTMGQTGMGDWIDSISNTVSPVTDFFSNAATSVASAVGLMPSEATVKWVLGRFGDGSEAAKLNAAQSKLNTQLDAAAKVLASARALPDSNSKSAGLRAANTVIDALHKSQYALNDSKATYNEIASLINGLPGAPANAVSALRGLNGWAIPVLGVAAFATAAYLVKQYLDNEEKRLAVDATVAEAMKDPAYRADYIRLKSQDQNKDGPGSACSVWDPRTYQACFDQGSGQVVKSALTLGGIGLAFYVAYRVFEYVADRADSGIRYVGSTVVKKLESA